MHAVIIFALLHNTHMTFFNIMSYIYTKKDFIKFSGIPVAEPSTVERITLKSNSKNPSSGGLRKNSLLSGALLECYKHSVQVCIHNLKRGASYTMCINKVDGSNSPPSLLLISTIIDLEKGCKRKFKHPLWYRVTLNVSVGSILMSPRILIGTVILDKAGGKVKMLSPGTE